MSIAGTTTEGPTTSTLTDLLATWVPRQRWFAAHGSHLTLNLTGATLLRSPTPAHPTPTSLVMPPAPAGREVPPEKSPTPPTVVIELHVLDVLVDGEPGGTYQVPVTVRTAPEPSLEAALIGELPSHGTTPGPLWVYDGPRDPAFVTALIASLAAPEPTRGEGVTLRGRLRDGVPAPDPFAPATVIAGEQSNTSIIVRCEPPVIAKVFRVLQSGPNPDIAIPRVLSDVGTHRVPNLVGWVEGEWTSSAGETVSGHLAAVAEFVAGADDGWKLACVAVEEGRSFAAEAEALGEAVAEVHAAMALALPVHPSTPESLQHLAAHLRERLAWALDAVPTLRDLLGERAESAARVFDAVATNETAPPMQQIHGDLHLGQTLHNDARGWVVLDFEGEPLRPLAERTTPDLALRDVAGMLRSFDYAARQAIINDSLSSGQNDDDRAIAADAWASDCRAAFLAGYSRVAGPDHEIDMPVLVALELDKALYEVVYETRHRPTWAAIPLSAVNRLAAG